MFFDYYDRFFKTSKVFPNRDRLNLRQEAIFEGNRDVLQGARVLDIASHDGRWSFAALRSGASHVTGIEARPELVDNAYENFSHYGEKPDSYTFLCGDVFEMLSQHTFEVDVILCLGFLYHTYRHTELLHHIRRIDPTYLIIDTYVVPGVSQPLVKLFTDRPDNQGKAILDPYGHAQRTLVGRPSVPALKKMLHTYDFEVEHTYDWNTLLAAYPNAKQVNDYRTGWRVTIRGRSGVSTPTTEEPSHDAQSGGAALRRTQQSPQNMPTQPAHARTVSSSSTGRRWRHWVNRGLAKTIGYELRRVETTRRS